MDRWDALFGAGLVTGCAGLGWWTGQPGASLVAFGIVVCVVAARAARGAATQTDHRKE